MVEFVKEVSGKGEEGFIFRLAGLSFNLILYDWNEETNGIVIQFNFVINGMKRRKGLCFNLIFVSME